MISGFLENVYRDVSHASADKSASAAASSTPIHDRSDYAMIAEMIEPGSRVLDLGCGEGELLAWLRDQKQVDGRGVEIDANRVQRAIARGVSAYQSDIDNGLADYQDGTFDFVILSQTLQETRYPLQVLREMLRVGRHGIVAFPNFGHWSTRLSHLFSGRAPQTSLFPYKWYESPNLHFLTVDDFVQLCRAQNWIIERQFFLSGSKNVQRWVNLFAELAVFSIRPNADS
jgi:methionine biosynthesis protein MetW